MDRRVSSRSPSDGNKVPPAAREHVIFAGRSIAMTVRGPVVCTACTGDVALDVGRAQQLLDAMRRLRDTSHRDLLLYAYVMEEGVRMPDASARPIGAKVMELFDHCVGVHEGHSWRAAALRGVLTSVAMLSRVSARGRIEVAADVASAGELMAPRTTGLVGAHAIAESIESARRLAAG